MGFPCGVSNTNPFLTNIHRFESGKSTESFTNQQQLTEELSKG
jgi:hypothetical protein